MGLRLINEPMARSVTLNLQNNLVTVTWYDEGDEEQRRRVARGHFTLKYSDGSETRLEEAVIGHPLDYGRNDPTSYAITYTAKHFSLQPV